MKMTLRAARAQAGVTRKKVAERLGVNVGTIWRWERGIMSPPADVAEKICALYGVAFEDIDWGKKGGA